MGFIDVFKIGSVLFEELQSQYPAPQIFAFDIEGRKMNDAFFEAEGIAPGDIMICRGVPYFACDWGDGSCFAKEIPSMGLGDWLNEGNTHPRVDSHGRYFDGHTHRSDVCVFTWCKTYIYEFSTGVILEVL